MTSPTDISEDERAPGAATPGDEQKRPARRRGGVAIVGVITAIAVLAAAAPIIWARLSASGTDDARFARPDTLADGSPPRAVPEAVASAAGATVVGTARLDDPTPLVEGCDLGGADVEVRDAVVTPDHATLVARTDNPPPNLEDFAFEPGSRGDTTVMCVAAWRGDRWQHLLLAGRRGGDLTQPAWLCCDERGRSTIFHLLQAPEGAAWLLEDRGTHAVAYDVAGRDTLGFAAAGADAAGAHAHLWWVDAGGTIVDEAYIGEAFFGEAFFGE